MRKRFYMFYDETEEDEQLMDILIDEEEHQMQDYYNSLYSDSDY